MPADRSAALAGAVNVLRETAAEADGALLDGLARDLAGASACAPVALRARRELLRELLAVAIDEAGDTAAEACARLLRANGPAADVRSAVAELSGLLDLLEAMER